MDFWFLLFFTSLAIAPGIAAILIDSYWNLGIFWESMLVAIALEAIVLAYMWRCMPFVVRGR